MIEVISFTYDNKTLSALSAKIRQKVFVEEQNVDPALEYDGNDPGATHYLCYYNRIPVGTARWRRTTNGVKLERFAILPPYRNLKIGRELLDFVLNDVKKVSGKIYLHAQEKAVNYYLRAGFAIVGEAFYEAGIKHYKMILSKRP
ncbi:MAG: putative N-acetyltransferase YjcF [Bacteroidetes bacterium ADurb.Bin408]|nr:MAG: putative N-acetyltransferase YjcF [Bacteroidetes bacterium ADurb.Bin408]